MKDRFQKAPKKSRDDQMIDGVCAGIAKEAGVDPFWIRLLAALLIPVSAGTAIVIYIILAIIMDREPAQ